MMNLNGRLRLFWTIASLSVAASIQVEYLITFLGYDTAHNVWQEDMTNCGHLVQDYWAGKPESERLVVMLSSHFSRAHARQLI